MSIDSEHQLFRMLPIEFKLLIKRRVYNRRKRKLFDYINKIREALTNEFNIDKEYFIVDSMPLEICKLSRSSRSKVYKEINYVLPNKGYCASQNTHYYGYKLHAVCSAKGVFQSIDISPASVHDIHFLKDISEQMKDCTLLGDRGYLSTQYQLDLFTSCNIKTGGPYEKKSKELQRASLHTQKI